MKNGVLGVFCCFFVAHVSNIYLYCCLFNGFFLWSFYWMIVMLGFIWIFFCLLYPQEQLKGVLDGRYVQVTRDDILGNNKMIGIMKSGCNEIEMHLKCKRWHSLFYGLWNTRWNYWKWRNSISLKCGRKGYLRECVLIFYLSICMSVYSVFFFYEWNL